MTSFVSLAAQSGIDSTDRVIGLFIFFGIVIILGVVATLMSKHKG